MAVKAMGPYDYPSADRAENFGDDQLVYVHWAGNPTLCAAAAFRAPKAMAWEVFKTTMIDPWAASDADYDPATTTGWTLFDEPFQPDPGVSLTDLGIGHKALLAFRTA